jgi:hypothetical protein
VGSVRTWVTGRLSGHGAAAASRPLPVSAFPVSCRRARPGALPSESKLLLPVRPAWVNRKSALPWRRRPRAPDHGLHAGRGFLVGGLAALILHFAAIEEIVALYRLTLGPPPHNFQPRYNVCPTTTIDTIVGLDGKRELVPMRWGLVPSWWSKTMKELATFDARAFVAPLAHRGATRRVRRFGTQFQTSSCRLPRLRSAEQ